MEVIWLIRSILEIMILNAWKRHASGHGQVSSLQMCILMSWISLSSKAKADTISVDDFVILHHSGASGAIQSRDSHFLILSVRVASD